MNDSSPQAMSRFLRFDGGEEKGREYYICRANWRRFTAGTVGVILLGVPIGFMVLSTGLSPVLATLAGGGWLALSLLYFSLRKLKATHGLAAFTRDRLVYYEYNDHPHVNIHSMNQVRISDISAVRLLIHRSLLRREMLLAVWTPSSLAMAIGAVGKSAGRGRVPVGVWILGFLFLAPLAIVAAIAMRATGSRSMEPGPDADEFAQEIGAQVAKRRAAAAAARLSV